MKAEKPVYEGGRDEWWKDVVGRTAVESGAEPAAVKRALPQIYDGLMESYRAKDAYKCYEDVERTLNELQHINIGMGIVTNGDARIRQVLQDLGLNDYFATVVISEEEGVEKPNAEIWRRALAQTQTRADEALHVGNDLKIDYWGAIHAGLQALHLRRDEPKIGREDSSSVRWIASLWELPGFFPR